MLPDIKKKRYNIFKDNFWYSTTDIVLTKILYPFFQLDSTLLCVFFLYFALVLPIARGRPGNWRLLTKTTMPYTAHTVCPTGISGPYVTKGIFHTGLNRLGIRNKLEIHNISILLIEARKEVGGSVVTTSTRAIG